jgi:hypothetical protein
MGIVRAGILGRVSGKVANVVGGSWKGIQYLRELVIPNNPRSPAQTANRVRLKLVTLWAKTLTIQIAQLLLNPVARKMSGINLLVRLNFRQFTNINSVMDITRTGNTGLSDYFDFDQRFQLTRGIMPVINNFALNIESLGLTLEYAFAGIESFPYTEKDFAFVVISDLAGLQPPILKYTRLDNSINSGNGIEADGSGGDGWMIMSRLTLNQVNTIKQYTRGLYCFFICRFADGDLDKPIIAQGRTTSIVFNPANLVYDA